MKRYNLINNSLGWLVFVIAAFTYLSTIEPTASFWDCGEFTSQGYKLEVGHPPGNPIFILAARFFINFASGPDTVAICVNTMSALLSAATILLLFWTITHLVKRLIVKDDETDFSLQKMIVIMGSGVVGALAYTWSDTFWFSAVEGEVYAFSSFCTALVFWLILKWENRCDNPHSDRYLVAIAYTIGVSIAVHLLNLLCIPAIVLVIYYRKFKNTNAKGSLLALAVSFVIIVLILFGLVPGFVEIAQYFELLFVNDLGMGFNSGVMFYAVLLTLLFAWSIYELYTHQNEMRMKLAFFLAVVASGMFFIGDGFLMAILLTIALGIYLFKYYKKVPVRIFSNIILCITVIFIGYSSYALILIRSNAQTPMDQNSPDNVFALADYLNREQYGKTPLFYGPVYNAPMLYEMQGETQKPIIKRGKPLYAKEVKVSSSDPDRYRMIGYSEDYTYSPEMNMLFPRLYSPAAAKGYSDWLGGIKGKQVEAPVLVDKDGNSLYDETLTKPTFGENLKYFFSYQLNYMYWRYFMWNFSGRQNDIQGMGEITHGNWISGIPFIDNPRLGDQSLLPDDLGKGNAGHNVFFMLPLLLGIIGLLWQAYKDKRGIEQFWVVFFLFFMTGIAIVLYLNQTPSQPRERDYAYAGSFYAFAIWIGMGVAGLWRLMVLAQKRMHDNARKTAAANKTDEPELKDHSTAFAIVAAVLGVIVPLQMVSQTWDDHDRSGRYAARDFGMNYLSSVDENGIIFTNGDNDTFPLWYAQEVEGWRTDVRVVNLSYLATDWYINQMRRYAYESTPLPMQAPKDAYAYNQRQFNYFLNPDTTMMVPVEKSLEYFYGPNVAANRYNLPEFKYPIMYQKVDKATVLKNGVVAPYNADAIVDYVEFDLRRDSKVMSDGGLSASKVMSIDIIASVIREGWKRPVFFASTVPTEYYEALVPYLETTGMANEVVPILHPSNRRDSYDVNTDKAYRNITEKFRWGGLDKGTPGHTPYLDETVRRMVTTTRSAMTDLVQQLLIEGLNAQQLITPDDSTHQVALAKGSAEYKEAERIMNDRFVKARNVLTLLRTKLPDYASPYTVQMGERIARMYYTLGELSGNKADTERGNQLLEKELLRYAQYARYYQSLSPSQYSLLSNLDMYIDVYYVVDLLQLYNQYNPDKAEAMMARMTAEGADLHRIINRYPQN